MPEQTAQRAPHFHECPVVGCHKKYQCHGADCARFTYKNCADHAIGESKIAKPPKAEKKAKQKPSDPAPPSEPAAPVELGPESPPE